MTLMVLLSCLVALIFLAAVAWALIQINTQLAAIGGTPESFLAKLRLGLRAIEKQTSHLPPMVGEINTVLSSINNLQLERGMTEAAYWIWGITLAIIALIIVPVAWSLLNQALSHTKSIREYSHEMLQSGLGIAEHTSHTQQLGLTLEHATEIVGQTKGLHQLTTELAQGRS